MSVITARVSPSLRRRLEEEAERRGFTSLSQAVNAALEQFVAEEGLKWKSVQEVRLYFKGRKRRLHGLEELHAEEEP